MAWASTSGFGWLTTVNSVYVLVYHPGVPIAHMVWIPVSHLYMIKHGKVLRFAVSCYKLIFSGSLWVCVYVCRVSCMYIFLVKVGEYLWTTTREVGMCFHHWSQIIHYSEFSLYVNSSNWYTCGIHGIPYKLKLHICPWGTLGALVFTGDFSFLWKVLEDVMFSCWYSWQGVEFFYPLFMEETGLPKTLLALFF